MDDFEEKIESLEKEVHQITSITTTNTVKKETKQFNFNSSIVIYFILPFLIFIVLFAWKPSLLLEDKRNERNERKLNHKKLIVATIVLTIIINTIIILGVIVYKN